MSYVILAIGALGVAFEIWELKTAKNDKQTGFAIWKLISMGIMVAIGIILIVNGE